MKRLTAVFLVSVCAVGIGAYKAYAKDCTWLVGAGTVAFNTAANWSCTAGSGGAFPGGTTSGASRVIDRATVSVKGTTNDPDFTTGNGLDNTSFVQHLIIDASTNSPAAPVTLTVSGGFLDARLVTMTSGAGGSENAKLVVSGVNSFFPGSMRLIGHASNAVILDIDESTVVSGRTYMETNVQVDVLGGKVLNLGTLILKDETTLKKLGTGVMQTS